MRKSICGLSGVAVLLVSLFTPGGPKEASAEVNIGISIGAPPPLQFAHDPDVVVVPSGSSYVYMVPDSVGVYFHNGLWYRSHNGHWFRSSIYNGSWAYVDVSIVPQVVTAVPPEYIYYMPRGYHRIHHRDLHKHWRTWGHRRHWDRYDWYKHEMRADVKREKFRRIEREHRHPEGHGRPLQVKAQDRHQYRAEGYGRPQKEKGKERQHHRSERRGGPHQEKGQKEHDAR